MYGTVVQAGTIYGGVTIHAPSSPAFVPPRQLPAAVFGFVDRTHQLDSLQSQLAELTSAPGTQPAIALLTGTAGVGKTALAVHWAHRVQDRFPDGHLYVDLLGYSPNNPLRPEEVLDQLLRTLGVDGEDIPTDLWRRAGRFRTLVNERRILLILDNVHEVDQVRPLLPGSGSCFVVATSRDALPGLVVREGARRVDLDMLLEPDAVTLLHTLIGPRASAEPDAVEALAVRCARLPLALRIAADLVVTRENMAIRDLVEELADEQHYLDLLDAGGDPHTAVRSVFSWSYTNLPESAARVFRLMGTYPGRDISVEAIAVLADIDKRTSRQAAATLSRAHLLAESAYGRFQMHDMLRAYATELAHEIDSESARESSLGRLFDHYLVDLENAGVERPNILALFDVAGVRWPDRTIRMSRAFGPHLDREARHDDGLVLYTHALSAARANDDPAELGWVLDKLGIVHRRLGDYQQALEHHQQALTIHRTTNNHDEQGRTLNNLGIVHRRLGDYQQALEHHQQALAIHRTTNSRAREANALTSLGIVHRKLGLHSEAFEYHRQALEIHRDQANRVGEASALARMGMVYERLGRGGEALDCFGQALSIHQENGNYTQTGRALNNIGIAHNRQHRHHEAVHFLNEALTLHRMTGNRTDEGHALNALGLAHRQLDDLPRALELLRQALEAHESTGNRVEAGHVLNNLGDVYRHMGRIDESVACHQQALEIAEETGNDLLRSKSAWSRP